MVESSKKKVCLHVYEIMIRHEMRDTKLPKADTLLYPFILPLQISLLSPSTIASSWISIAPQRCLASYILLIQGVSRANVNNVVPVCVSTIYRAATYYKTPISFTDLPSITYLLVKSPLLKRQARQRKVGIRVKHFPIKISVFWFKYCRLCGPKILD